MARCWHFLDLGNPLP